MAMTKQFKKTQWNNDREPAITAEQLNRMEKGIDDNDTRIVELDKAVTENKTAGDKSLAEVNKTLQKHTEDITAANTELTSQGKAIGELADKKITKFYASSQGDTTLSDSDDGKMQDMMLYGKSEQKQYSGKNLLNKENDIANVFLDPSNNILSTTNGFHVCYAKIDPNTTYTASKKEGSMFRVATFENIPSVSEKFISTMADHTATKITFTSEKNTNYVAVGYWGNEETGTYSSILDSVQIEKGSEATSYEPYVGGIPSPNPDYPQEIKSVVEPVVKVTGKNLFEPRRQTLVQSGVTCTNNGDGTYTLNGTATANDAIRLDQTSNQMPDNLHHFKGTYTFSRSDTSYIAVVMQNVTWKQGIILQVGQTKKTATIDLKNCFIYIYSVKGTKYNDVLVDLQLEKNDMATYFEPYREQSVTLTGITLNAIPVSSGGNVTIDGQQYISDYVDVERGKIVRRVGKTILNGSEGWGKDNDGQVESHRMYSKISKKAISTGNVGNAKVGAMCSHFIEKTPIETWVKSQSAFSIQNGDTLQFRKIGILTVVDWKSWLSKNNITVYYPLATPTEESLSDELAEKLKALQTYYSQTNLFITSNQLNGYAIFNYPISLANGWNYVKQQIGDTRDYIYDMDLQMAQAYVNSEYAVALTELEV